MRTKGQLLASDYLYIVVSREIRGEVELADKEDRGQGGILTSDSSLRTQDSTLSKKVDIQE